MVVALVVVELFAVKFCKVVELVSKRLAMVDKPFIQELPETVKAVVEAYGKVEAVVEVAVK